VLEAVDAGRHAAPDLLGPVGVGDHGEPLLVGLVHHRPDLVHRHLVLIDELDDVDLGLGEPPHLGAGVVGAVNPPAVGLGAGIGLVLEEGAGDVESGARDLPLAHGVAHGQDVVERRAEVAGGGHAGEEELAGRRRHDRSPEELGIGLVPVIVVGVADDHQVDVHVPQPREHAHPFRRDHLGPIRDLYLAHPPDLLDPLAGNKHDAVFDRPAAVAVDQPAADQGGDSRRLGDGRRGRSGGQGEQGQGERQGAGERPSLSHHVILLAGEYRRDGV
jgi:hypothetical protein